MEWERSKRKKEREKERKMGEGIILMFYVMWLTFITPSRRTHFWYFDTLKNHLNFISFTLGVPSPLSLPLLCPSFSLFLRIVLSHFYPCNSDYEKNHIHSSFNIREHYNMEFSSEREREREIYTWTIIRHACCFLTLLLVVIPDHDIVEVSETSCIFLIHSFFLLSYYYFIQYYSLMLPNAVTSVEGKRNLLSRQ